MVTAAAFAWTICQDWVKHRRQLRADEVADEVQDRLPPAEDSDIETVRSVIVIVVNNAINEAGERHPD